jgi:hypothetical protein
MVIPEEAGAWFKALPAYTEATEAIAPLHEAAGDAVDALYQAIEEHATAVRGAVRTAEDAPKLDPVEIKPEIAIELPAPMFQTLDDFSTATFKLIARKSLAIDDDGGDAP